MVSTSPHHSFHSSCDKVPNYPDIYNNISWKDLMIGNNTCDRKSFWSITGWTVPSVWDGMFRVKLDFLDRISFFLHKLFFLFKFHFLLTYLLSFPSPQSVDWLWLRWAIGVFIIYCVIMKHSVCLLRFFPVCLTLFRRFALRGPAPAAALKRAPSRRSCKHNQWCIYYKIVHIMMYRIICCRKPHRTFTHTWENTTPYLKRIYC